MVFIAVAAWGIVAVVGISLWINDSWRRASVVIKSTQEEER